MDLDLDTDLHFEIVLCKAPGCSATFIWRQERRGVGSGDGSLVSIYLE